MSDAPADSDRAAAAGSAQPSQVIPLDKLSDAQAFARDPEDYTTETTADTIARLSKILTRYRKARDDEAALLESAAKIKATNAKAKKAKAKKNPTADIFEEPM